jgi:hypothetical protein
VWCFPQHLAGGPTVKKIGVSLVIINGGVMQDEWKKKPMHFVSTSAPSSIGCNVAPQLL